LFALCWRRFRDFVPENDLWETRNFMSGFNLKDLSQGFNIGSIPKSESLQKSSIQWSSFSIRWIGFHRRGPRTGWQINRKPQIKIHSWDGLLTGPILVATECNHSSRHVSWMSVESKKAWAIVGEFVLRFRNVWQENILKPVNKEKLRNKCLWSWSNHVVLTCMQLLDRRKCFLERLWFRNE
jgi:hypothetical protein